MRQAILITGLETSFVRIDKSARYYQQIALRPLMATDGEILIPEEELTVTEKVVPITQFCRPGRPDVYIAYSEEVEDMLGVPFRVMLKEKEQALAEAERLRNLTAWQHIKRAWQIVWRPTHTADGAKGG
jgi:hypothetical protein